MTQRRQLRMGLKLSLDAGGVNSPQWPLSAASTPTVPFTISKPRTPTSISAANTPASPSTHLDILQCLTLQGHTPTGTPTNESCPSLVSGGSSAANLTVSTSITGRQGELKAVLPDELAKRMRRPRPFLLLDCRPEFMYRMNHIYGAVNVNLTDRLIRRRLQNLGKVNVCEIMTSKEAKALYRKRVLKEVVIYDEKTMDWTELPPYDHLQILLSSLKNDGKDPAVLIGGFTEFHAQFSDLCDGAAMKSQPASSQLLSSPTNSASSDIDLEKVEASQVLPFLFLGNERDAGDRQRLADLKIKYILNVTSHYPFMYEKEGIRYLRLPASDSGQQNLMQYFQEAFDFIDEARRADSNILIHCQAGVSRSATIVVAYVMHNLKLTMDEAYKLVKDKRSVISPNLNFMGQLFEYQKRLDESNAQQQEHSRQGYSRPRVLSHETSL